MGLRIQRRENQAVVVPYDLGNQVAGLHCTLLAGSSVPVNVNVVRAADSMHARGAMHEQHGKGTTAIKHAPLFN
jgi:hypothetical protein